MIKLGTTDIKGIMLGNTEIVKAYLGTDVVYQNLPYDAEIEYLESTGTQYIDTGIIPYQGLEATIDFQYTSLNNNQCLFGSWKSSPNRILYTCCLYNDKWYFGSHSSQEGNVYWKNNVVDTERHIISIDGNGSISQDSVSLGTTDVSYYNTPLPVYIFGRNVNGEFQTNSASNIRCYSFVMVNNGKLIFNGIPVRVGTIGYMYDKVSGQLFGNSDTGSFVLGPDVTE